LVFGFVVEKEGIVSNPWMFSLLGTSAIFKKKGKASGPWTLKSGTSPC
jgi:hypothetical protein